MGTVKGSPTISIRLFVRNAACCMLLFQTAD
jgi:hypothetical protein